MYVNGENMCECEWLSARRFYWGMPPKTAALSPPEVTSGVIVRTEHPAMRYEPHLLFGENIGKFRSVSFVSALIYTVRKKCEKNPLTLTLRQT